MSEEHGTPADGPRGGDGGAAGAVSRTAAATRMALRRRGSRAVFAGVTLAYLVAYLVAIGDVVNGRGRVGLVAVADPLGRLFDQSVGVLRFEPVARVDLGLVSWLVSPLNLALGLGLAALVGANLALTYLAWRQPKACGLGRTAGAGVLAALPALFSGAACCAPAIVIALGLQVTGLTLAAISWLVPVAALLLLGSLLYVGRQVDPVAVANS